MTGPIKVWLSQPNDLTVTCRIFEDDGEALSLINSLNMRGAQREITSRLVYQGYTPVERWQPENDDGTEYSRKFRPA